MFSQNCETMKKSQMYIKEEVDVGLEHCSSGSLQMTLKYIYSTMKLLHHRDFQYWSPQGPKAVLFMYFHGNHTHPHTPQTSCRASLLFLNLGKHDTFFRCQPVR
ncbi:hypothetical protein ATANTOWER_028835 [Ataeniobius toweri]|uniref:Uncharacterized protein n=1 Tax=Ataeniobius toweri TaxID=208326 RepID=A0ABU7AA91_9TELE|nr:hypothetical protein [Ataeniobius toweri]